MLSTPLHELIPVLQVAIGPVILISGISLLLLTLTNRFARTIDNTPHYSYFHILDTRVFFTPDWHLVAQIGLDLIRHVLEKRAAGAATPGTRGDLGREATESQCLENLLADDHFFRAIPVRQRRK